MFEDEGHSVQGCKSYFLCNSWVWAKGFLVSGPPSILDFIDWFGLCLRGCCFCWSLVSFLRHSLTSFVFFLCTLGCFIGVPFLILIYCLLLIKKKKKKLGLSICLILCKWVSDLLSLVLSLFGVFSVLPQLVRDFLFTWQHLQLGLKMNYFVFVLDNLERVQYKNF